MAKQQAEASRYLPGFAILSLLQPEFGIGSCDFGIWVSLMTSDSASASALIVLLLVLSFLLALL